MIMPAQEKWPRGPKNELHFAADTGSTQRTAAILSSGLININQGDPDGWTPLMVASQRGYTRIVRILVKEGANVLIVADLGFTALLTCAQYGNLAVCKMLVNAGADLEAATSTNGSRPLHLAADKGHAALIKALIEAGANLNSRRFDRATPLYIACERGHVEAVRAFLRAKADPLLIRLNVSRDRFVPLDAAAGKGRSLVVREFLDQLGIDGCGGPSRGAHALYHAAKEQFVDTMAVLANAGVVDTGIALIGAIKENREGSIKFLLRQQQLQGNPTGAYVDEARDPFGRTPLLCSIEDEGLVDHYLGENRVIGRDITEEQAHKLNAVHRLLLRVEAVHAASWLWVSDAPDIAHTAEVTKRTKVTPSPRSRMFPVLGLSTRRNALLSAVLRYSSKT
ncbi:EsV-1-199 [Ectocarpus siliculosus]|uniref:EsV-1-199 n=1 Tax=Ectocarpus siliculosus TaxID=2880 RepID=D7G1I8_ECTSI|nr:EsV-1-199 [Ectocarpus siliculosus]|eukprot:CBJ26796.1 EsV-1-199 [Ectocarpus siliculosus]